MNCPKCSSELIYEEDIQGKFSYPIEKGLIDFQDRTFSGDSLGHRIKCINEDCDYMMPRDELYRVFLRSLKDIYET